MKLFRLTGAFAVAGLCLITSSLASPAHADVLGTPVAAAILTVDTTWTAQGSPYLLDGKIQIASGATLTVQAGASIEVRHNQSVAFEVAGAFVVNGSAAEPVAIVGVGNRDLAAGAADNNAQALIDINHASISNFSGLLGVNSSYTTGSPTVRLHNSIVHGGKIWAEAPKSLDIVGNAFDEFGGIHMKIFRAGPFTIANNRFRGYRSQFTATPPQVEIYYSSGEQVVSVGGNTFEPGPTYDISTSATRGTLDARNNYWETEDLDRIRARVLDGNDDINRAIIPIEPILTQPSAETPVLWPQIPQDLKVQSGDHSITATWSPPTSDGGSPVTSYKATCAACGFSKSVDATNTSVTFDNLTNGLEHAVEVLAINRAGQSLPATGKATPVGVPAQPSKPTAARGDQSATVSWVKPSDNGSPVTGYVVEGSPGSSSKTITDPGATSTTITGLTNGTAYTFTVKAVNAVGTSPASDASDAVTPRVPGPCSISVPSKVVVDSPLKQITGSLGSDCASSGEDRASWDVIHSYYGHRDFFLFGTGQTTDQWSFYDSNPLGTYSVAPNGAYDIYSNQLPQNSRTVSVRLGSRLALSTSRSGNYVTLKASATRYSPSADAFRAWTGKSVTFYKKSCSSCSWHYVATRTTNTYGHASYKAYASTARYWRAVTNDSSNTWGRTSATRYR